MGNLQKFLDSMVKWCCQMDMHYDQGNRYDFRYGGSSDCSAMAAHALREGGYDVPESVWSGNIADCLEEIGWTRSTDSGYPPRGAVLVNYNNHVAVWFGDNICEFGGDPHDGYRCVHSFYDYPWDCYMCPPSEEESDAQSSTGAKPRYRVFTREHGWLEWMTGLSDSSSDGDDFAGIEGEWVYGVEADFHFVVVLMDGTESGWVTRWDDCGQAVRGIKIEDLRYQAHVAGGGWLKVENGMSDDGAGDDVHAIDMLRVW